MAAKDGLNHRAFVKLEVVLAEHRQTFARPERNRAVGRRELTRQYAHKGGLARTVGTDYTVAIALGEGKVHVLEKRFLAELYGKIVDLYHSLVCFF